MEPSSESQPDSRVRKRGIHRHERVVPLDRLRGEHPVERIAMNNMAVAAIVQMRNHAGGHIVNISSIDGLTAHPDNAHYAATKAAVISLPRSLALEVAPLGIVVNSVAPGPMATETAKQSDWYDDMVDALPTKHPIEPTEVAKLVGFLASTENRSISGENVIISGAGLIA